MTLEELKAKAEALRKAGKKDDDDELSKILADIAELEADAGDDDDTDDDDESPEALKKKLADVQAKLEASEREKARAVRQAKARKERIKTMQQKPAAGDDDAEDLEKLKADLAASREEARTERLRGKVRDLVADKVKSPRVINLILAEALKTEGFDEDDLEEVVGDIVTDYEKEGLIPKATTSPGARPGTDGVVRRPEEATPLAPDGDLRSVINMGVAEKLAYLAKHPEQKEAIEGLMNSEIAGGVREAFGGRK